MQSHNGLDYPNLDEYEKSIDAFAACGVKVLITELDINVLPNPQGFGGAGIEQNFEFQQKYNPYTAGLPADKQKELSSTAGLSRDVPTMPCSSTASIRPSLLLTTLSNYSNKYYYGKITTLSFPKRLYG